MRSTFFELVRYGMTGGISSLAYFLVSNLTNWMGLPAWASAFCGWLCAVVVAYLGHMHFTYRVAAEHKRMSPRYLVNALFNLAYTEFMTYFVLGVLLRPYWQSSLAVIVTLPFFSYPMGKFWAFKSSTQDADA